MIIGNKKISKKSQPFIIAEIGLNHNGLIKNATRMIDYAADANCSAVKFQTIDVDEALIPNTPLAKYQKKINNSKNMNNLIKKYNFSFEKFSFLKKYCDNKKILFLSTPFDFKSAIFLNYLKLKAFKISSGDNDNYPLLSLIKNFKKPLIISTGMSLNSEIKKMLNFLNLSRNKLSLLHCISDYPTRIKETQLKNIQELSKFGYNVGFSDHTIGEVSSYLAVSNGASIIEKHITLDRNMEGPDHKVSLECKYLKNFVNNLNEVKNVFLEDRKRFLTEGEKSNLIKAKKSIYFKNNLKKNSLIKKSNLKFARPRSNGLSPSLYNKIIGKKLKKNVFENELVNLKHLKYEKN